MIIRKYTDGDSNFELSVNAEEKRVLFQIERDDIFVSIELDHKDCKDLQDRLYDLLREIEPAKPKSNG